VAHRLALILGAVLAAAPTSLRAQQAAPIIGGPAAPAASVTLSPCHPACLAPTPVRHFSWPKFAAGFVTSLAAHETAHILTAVAMGGHVSLGFNSGRPVIQSGIDSVRHPTRQFFFSAAGMSTQLLINEVILDWPHGPGVSGEFERGVLASGIATVVFYFTVGRDSQVSDVQQMSVNSSLSKWDLTAIFGGIAATDVVRMLLKPRYAHFFAYPAPKHGLTVGMRLPL